jgi:hypothetical protein
MSFGETRLAQAWVASVVPHSVATPRSTIRRTRSGRGANATIEPESSTITTRESPGVAGRGGSCAPQNPMDAIQKESNNKIVFTK